MNKVLFLDIDGVLNSTRQMVVDQIKPGLSLQAHSNPTPEVIRWDVRCTRQLQRILTATDAYIVITSSWRHSTSTPLHFNLMLSAYGIIDRVIGLTPRITRQHFAERVNPQERGLEIQAWLNENPQVQSYVILDDSSDFLMEQMPFFVRTTSWRGLSQGNADDAIRILNGEL